MGDRGQCYKCGKSGHMARDCFDSSNRRSGGGGFSGQRSELSCYNCRQKGHIAKDCGSERQQNFGRPVGGGGGGGTSYNSGQPGHVAKDCSDGGGIKLLRCSNCRREGHLARDCR